jgi:hypothetical protein
LGTVAASAADPVVVETNEVTVEAGQTLPSSGSVQFSDVGASHWAKTAIQTAVSKGYVTGYPGGKFKPEQAITRGEFMKMVVTALGLPTEAAEGTWYEPYVKAAQNQSLYAAVDFANNETQWNKDITRQEMARIAVRAIGQATSENDKWMYLATKSGLITGLGKGVLGEDKTTTRAQSVTIIERILEVNTGEVLPVDKYAVSNAELAWHGTNIFTVMPEIFVSDESELKGKSVEELWKEEMMTITSKDGKYKAQLEALIAIDMEDPNDPNWKLLPPVEELKWFDGFYEHTDLKITDWPESYLLVRKGRVIFNNDKTRYNNSLNFGTSGFESPKSSKRKFDPIVLDSAADVYHHEHYDLPVTIIPKKGWVLDSHGIEISLQTPSTSNYMSQNILKIYPPKN